MNYKFVYQCKSFFFSEIANGFTARFFLLQESVCFQFESFIIYYHLRGILFTIHSEVSFEFDNKVLKTIEYVYSKKCLF